RTAPIELRCWLSGASLPLPFPQGGSEEPGILRGLIELEDSSKMKGRPTIFRCLLLPRLSRGCSDLDSSALFSLALPCLGDLSLAGCFASTFSIAASLRNGVGRAFATPWNRLLHQ